MPYVWGTTGYGYDKRRARGTLDTWDPLFDPANRGQILMLDDMRECFAVALKYLGHSLNSTDPKVLREAADLLKKQKPLVKTYNSGDYENILAAGDVWFAHGYNGQIAKVAAREPEKLGYVAAEGGRDDLDGQRVPAARRAERRVDLRVPQLHPRAGGERAHRQRDLATRRRTSRRGSSSSPRS